MSDEIYNDNEEVIITTYFDGKHKERRFEIHDQDGKFISVNQKQLTNITNFLLSELVKYYSKQSFPIN